MKWRGGFENGVVGTDKWLDEFHDNPIELCKKANPGVKDANDFYKYLRLFGMYTPSEQTKKTIGILKKEKIWSKVDHFYQNYRKKWRGPNVDIYIFPINENQHFFMGQLKGKSGIAFTNKLFLFVKNGLEEKELEALFVHEYHHVTRMRKYKKELEQYTLLDSIIFEGLAELAVLNCCGKKYLAQWTKEFSNERIAYFMKHIYEPNLSVTREDRSHDDFLFGRRGIPRMLGYAVGFELVKGYVKNNKITMLDSFEMKSEEFLRNNHFLDKE